MLYPKDVALIRHDPTNIEHAVKVEKASEIQRSQLYYLVIMHDLQETEQEGNCL
jgi:hypothetical protein